MASKLMWDGKSRKGDAVIKDNDPGVWDVRLTVIKPYGKTLIDIEREGDCVTLDKSDAIELVKYLNTMIPTMKG